MIKYSIIIPFHSNLNLLTICVNALYKVLDFSESELIIVDNNVEFYCKLVYNNDISAF